MQENAKKRSGILKKQIKNERKGLLRGLSTVLRYGGTATVGFVFGQAEMLFGTHPLGLALLCVSGKYTGAVFAGLLFAAVFGTTQPIAYLCTYITVVLIRTVVGMMLDAPDENAALGDRLHQKLRREGEEADKGDRVSGESVKKPRFIENKLLLQLSLAAFGGMILGLYRVIGGGFRYYDLFATLFFLLATPLFAFVFRFRSERVHGVPHFVTVISEAALLFSLVWSCNRIFFFGLSVSAMVALFFSLLCCETRGVYLGIGAAVLCGVAYHLLYAPGFVMAALVYLLLKRLGKTSWGVLLGCLASLFWFVYLGGSLMLARYLPGCLAVGSILSLTLRFWKPQSVANDRDQEQDEDATETREEHLASSRHRDAKERFRGISDALSGLSEMFYNLSDRFRRPGTLDLRRICDRAMDGFCKECPNKTICWGVEYGETLEVVNRLISGLHTKGRVEASLFPEHMQNRCSFMPAMVEEINRECARVTYEMLRNNRTEIFAMDYEAAANIINDALEEDEGEYRFDLELEEKVAEYLRDAGVRFRGVTVYGSRRRQILVRGAEIEETSISAKTMRSDLGEMCGVEFGNPLFEVEGGISTMILRAKKKISVECAQSNISADGGVSGDTLTQFSNRTDFFYALINDGMGSGREAALTSNLCSVFLEKMLRAGNRATTSLRMLNNMIRSRAADSTDETSSTVDLLEIDLMTGEASFIKSGAAPSFVVRRDAVHRIQAGTAPIGIIRSLDAKKTAFQLKEGDTVVMISDGILQNDPECEWLRSYLSGAEEQTPDEIVYHICLHAASGESHDDCSAVALRIGAVDEEAV